MAYKKRCGMAVKAELKGAEFFWNIRSHVGYGYKNDKNDVLLVQFLINRMIDYHNDQCDVGDEIKTLETDGIFGGQTWNRIKWFQKEVKDDPKMADGMVSPVDGQRLLSPNTKQLYTIYALNKGYHLLYKSFYHDIKLDPTCPAALRHYLQVTEFTVGPGGSGSGIPFRGFNPVFGDGSVRF